MRHFPAPLKELVRCLSLFPGVGEKSALRMALHILKLDENTVERIGNSIINARREVRYCERCGFFTENSLCGICEDVTRANVICVVEDPQDIFPVEKSGEYRGRYHVLGGAISPIDGVMPKDLNIDGLVKRVEEEEIEEVIMATNLNVEGEATASYVSSLLKPLGVRVTRIAYGMPIGADLEYADEFTVGKAIAFRREI
jgi:recombination protein RecR